MKDSRLSSQEHVAAFLDLGTNSVRLLVASFSSDGSYRVLTEQKEVIRLGEGAFVHDRLQPAAVERAVLVCSKFAALARSYNAREIIAVATAATREATNQEELLTRLHDETGLIVHTVSGREEARLIYRGVSSGFHLGDRQALFIDIGGGSTELIVGSQDDYYYLDSLKLGAIRLTMGFFGDYTGVVSQEQYELLQRYIRHQTVRSIQRIRQYRIDLSIGSSGTIQNLADVAVRMFLQRRRERGDTLAFEHLSQVVRHLCALSVDERRRVPGLNPERADIIVAGAAIIHTLMQDLNLKELIISERGLREGLLVDYIDRTFASPVTKTLSVRERSVLQLARACQFNEDHARNVARLALELFDTGLEAGLYRLGSKERELLYYSALLHDIGAFISYSRHEEHTEYLIRNSELLGFDQTEVAIIALTARHHRKRPWSRQSGRQLILAETAQSTVRILSTLLRMAESLDRSHMGIVRHARLCKDGNRNILLQVQCDMDCQLELWGLKNQEPILRKVFGKPVHVVREHEQVCSP